MAAADDSNELVSAIHDRMPMILPPDAYGRWLANIEPDPRDLLCRTRPTDEDVAHP